MIINRLVIFIFFSVSKGFNRHWKQPRKVSKRRLQQKFCKNSEFTYKMVPVAKSVTPKYLLFA